MAKSKTKTENQVETKTEDVQATETKTNNVVNIKDGLNTVSSGSSRIRDLIAKKKAEASTPTASANTKDPKEENVKALRKRKMQHPLNPNKEISVVGFSECLAREGIGTDDYLVSEYVPKAVHEEQVAALQEQIDQLKGASASKSKTKTASK